MLAPNGKLDPAEAREQADAISIMLMSFPHMLPAATNQWKRRSRSGDILWILSARLDCLETSPAS